MFIEVSISVVRISLTPISLLAYRCGNSHHLYDFSFMSLILSRSNSLPLVPHIAATHSFFVSLLNDAFASAVVM